MELQVIDIDNMTIVEAWNNLKKIENKIDLLQTLRETKQEIKATNIKDILVSGGKMNNNAILNAIIVIDEYSEELHQLYKNKNAYEKYILEEVDRYRRNDPVIVVAFLKEYLKFKWDKIAKILNYSERQCRRFYDNYKGRNPKENCWSRE